MANFSSFEPDKPMSQIRGIINTNFTLTTEKPKDKENTNKKLTMVGVLIKNSQDLYHAIDGVDFLSPATGVQKEDPSDQNMKGNLKVPELEVGPKADGAPGSAIVHGPLTVYGDTTKPTKITLSTGANGVTQISEDLDVSRNITAGGTITSKGGINASTANDGSYLTNNLGIGNFWNINVGNNATIGNQLSVANSATVGSLVVNNGSALNGTTQISGALTCKSQATFNGSIVMTSPGSFSNSYVRPLQVGTSAPSYLAPGTLYGQY